MHSLYMIILTSVFVE